MKLKLSLTSISNSTSEELSSITLNKTTATLGRLEDNSLVLKDTQRFISAHHAKIDYRSPDYYLTDTSTNGVYINQSTAPIGKDNSIKLNNGDQIHIGDYTASVTLSDDISDSEPSFNQSEKFSDFIDYDKVDDPFGEITTDPVQGMIEENELLPSDWMNSEDKNPIDFSPSYSETEEISNKKELDELPAYREAFEPYVKQDQDDASPLVEDISSDTDDIFSENWFLEDKSTENRTEMNLNIKKDIDSKHISKAKTTSEEALIAEKKKDVSVTVNDLPQVTVAAEETLIEHFLRGANLHGDEFEKHFTPETFYIIGTILRASIHGAMDVLSSRAKIKQEMHLDMTMIRPMENNPIKFSISPEEALKKLLLPQEAGYLLPVEAVNEVFDDIRTHQLSVIAGMQKALISVIRRFDPEKIEQRFLEQNPIGANIPLRKQAKLWNLFEELYKNVEVDAKDDFYHLFGQVFAETYEKQSEFLLRNKEKETPG